MGSHVLEEASSWLLRILIADAMVLMRCHYNS